MTTTKKVLDDYMANLEARSLMVERQLDRIMEISNDGDLQPYDEVTARDAVIGLAMWDAENDQKEIANLISVANSTEFPEDVRTEASRRAALMLGL